MQRIKGEAFEFCCKMTNKWTLNLESSAHLSEKVQKQWVQWQNNSAQDLSACLLTDLSGSGTIHNWQSRNYTNISHIISQSSLSLTLLLLPNPMKRPKTTINWFHQQEFSIYPKPNISHSSVPSSSIKLIKTHSSVSHRFTLDDMFRHYNVHKHFSLFSLDSSVPHALFCICSSTKVIMWLW